MRRYWFWAILLFLISLALYLYYGPHALWDEEAMYAEVPNEMLISRDFLFPTLNFAPFIFKPPLFFWANAASMALFGFNDIAPRLPTLVFAAGTVAATFFIGARSGLRAGIFSAASLATFFGFVFHTSEMLTDVPLTFFTVASMYFFLKAADNEKGGVTGVYVSLALAVMTKGLVGLVFPGLAFMLFILAGRRWDILRRFVSLRGALLFIIITVPWHLAMEARHPGFLYNYVVNEQVLRFFNKRFPPDYDSIGTPVFILITLGWLMPWAVFLFQSLARAVRDKAAPVVRLALFWGLGGMAFLALSSSKMEYYSLPLLPAFAVIIGNYWAGLGGEDNAGHKPLAVAGAAALAAVAVIGMGMTACGHAFADLIGGLKVARADVLDLSAVAERVFAILLIGSSLTLSFIVRKKFDLAFMVFCMSALLMSASSRGALDIAAPFYSGAGVAKALAKSAGPGDAVILDGEEEYEYCATFNYYMGRKVRILSDDGKPVLPVKFSEKDRFIINAAEFRKLWLSGGRVFFVTDRGHDNSVIKGLPGREVDSLSSPGVAVYVNKSP